MCLCVCVKEKAGEMEGVTSKTDPKLSSIIIFQTTKRGICKILKSCDVICDMESHLRNTDASTTHQSPHPPPERTHTSILACNTAFLYNHALSCPNWLLCTCFSPPFGVEMSSKCFRGEQPEPHTCLTLIAHMHAGTHKHTHAFLLSPRTVCL